MSLEPGIFAKTFQRASLDEVLDAAAASGMRFLQFNLSCAGLASLPDAVEPALAAAVHDGFARRGLVMSAVSGTFNMIHPDRSRRAADLDRLGLLIETCKALGTSVITLCTGTRDPENMWRWHADNASPQAWRDLLASLGRVLPAAEARGVTLAFESEPANVIDRPQKAKRLLEELRSPALKVVVDAANLFHPGELVRMAEIIPQACDLLGGEIVLAHAKDLSPDGSVVAAGKGVLNYDLYLSELLRAGYSGPLILHGLAEEEVAGSLAFLYAARERNISWN